MKVFAKKCCKIIKKQPLTFKKWLGFLVVGTQTASRLCLAGKDRGEVRGGGAGRGAQHVDVGVDGQTQSAGVLAAGVCPHGAPPAPPRAAITRSMYSRERPIDTPSCSGAAVWLGRQGVHIASLASHRRQGARSPREGPPRRELVRQGGSVGVRPVVLGGATSAPSPCPLASLPPLCARG